MQRFCVETRRNPGLIIGSPSGRLRLVTDATVLGSPSGRLRLVTGATVLVSPSGRVRLVTGATVLVKGLSGRRKASQTDPKATCFYYHQTVTL